MSQVQILSARPPFFELSLVGGSFSMVSRGEAVFLENRQIGFLPFFVSFWVLDVGQ